MSDIIRRAEKLGEDIDRISEVICYLTIKVIAEEFLDLNMGMYPELRIARDCLELARYRITEMINKIENLADATSFIPEDVEKEIGRNMDEFIEKTYAEIESYLRDRDQKELK